MQNFKFLLVVRMGLFIIGKSTMVVTPPAAAADVPHSNPSQFSLAGSYRLTLQSMIPGIITKS